MRIRSFLLISTLGALALSGSAVAASIDWVSWSPSYTTGSITGSASGVIGSTPAVNVSYSGELIALYFGFPDWAPASTFDAGGLNAPPSANGGIRLYGGLTSLDTITFSTPVTDPYIAIWSLGDPTHGTSFVFNATPVLDSGGPSSEYGGTSITVSGNTVTGAEGNGVVHFSGTYSSISWNNPTPENYYMFTVGVKNDGGSENPDVPEPMTLAVFGMGLAGVAALRRRKSRA